MANFITTYFILSKDYTGYDGIKYLYHGLPACTEDNPRARGLSPRTCGQTVVFILLNVYLIVIFCIVIFFLVKV